MLKPKITIDTCVILPAYCWKRNSYLFMQHLDDYEWCLSEYIMDECKRILKNPKLAFFQEISKCVYLYKPYVHPCRYVAVEKVIYWHFINNNL